MRFRRRSTLAWDIPVDARGPPPNPSRSAPPLEVVALDAGRREELQQVRGRAGTPSNLLHSMPVGATYCNKFGAGPEPPSNLLHLLSEGATYCNKFGVGLPVGGGEAGGDDAGGAAGGEEARLLVRAAAHGGHAQVVTGQQLAHVGHGDDVEHGSRLTDVEDPRLGPLRQRHPDRRADRV